MFENKEYTVGKGWWPLLRMFESVCEIPGGKLVHYKEKFGQLDVFFSFEGNDQEIWNMLVTLENLVHWKSSKICEFCGEEGKLRNNLVWVKTCCDTHYEERKE